MATFMQYQGSKRSTSQERCNLWILIHRSLFRFHDENVAWMSEYFLGENTETRHGRALNNKQRMEVFLRHVGDPGFQTGVGEGYGNPSEYCL